MARGFLKFVIPACLLVPIYGCVTTTESQSTLKLSAYVKGAYDYYMSRRDAKFLAVSTDGTTYGVSFGFIDSPSTFRDEALRRCRTRAQTQCVVFAGQKSVVWNGDYEWLPDTSGSSTSILVCSHNSTDGPAIRYRARHKCKSGDYGMSIYQLEYFSQLVSQPKDLEKRTVRYTLRDPPDRDLCNTLVYGHPDHLKEAKRRGLTNKKCKEILLNN